MFSAPPCQSSPVVLLVLPVLLSLRYRLVETPPANET